MPARMTLSVHRIFYVYGAQDAAEIHQGQAPRVESQNLTIFPLPAAASNETLMKEIQANPGRFQAGLVPYAKLWDFLNVYGNFCGKAGLDLMDPKDKTGPQPVIKSARYPADGKEDAQELLASGTYALVVANCAEVDEGLSLSGNIAIRSPWGYLPITHYYKESLYGALAVVNSCVALIWLVFSLRWWRQLLTFQKGMAMVALVAVLESTLWWIFFVTWNKSGVVDKVLFWVSQMASEGKIVVAMVSVLSLELLAQDTRPGESCCEQADAVMPLKQHLLVTAFLVLEFNRAVNSHFRYSLAFDVKFVLANAAPAIILGIILFVCVHMRLSSVLDELKKRHSEEKSKLVSRTLCLMLIAFMLALVMSTLQFFDPTMAQDTSLWKYHFLVSDGVAQITFLVLLLAAMCISCPSDTLQEAAYAPQQMDDNVIGAPAVIWDDDDDLGEGPEKAETGGVE